MPAFHTSRLRLELTPPQVVARTSAVWWSPEVDAGRPGVVLGHSAGTNVTDGLLLAVGRGLAERGYPVLTFNFPYAEAGRKPPDRPARLESAFRDATAMAGHLMGGRPLVLGGRSMGGRIASRLAARGLACAGLVLLAYPLHPAKSRSAGSDSSRLRTDHWPDLSVPTLFVQGDRDPLCDLDVLARERRARLRDADSVLHVVEGGDHAFGLRKADGRAPGAVLEEIVATVGDWLDALPPERVVAG